MLTFELNSDITVYTSEPHLQLTDKALCAFTMTKHIKSK